DQQRAALVDSVRQSVQVAHVPEDIRLLHDDTGGLIVDQLDDALLLESTRADGDSTGNQFDVACREVRLDHLAPVRMDTAREHDAITPGDALRHEHGLADG